MAMFRTNFWKLLSEREQETGKRYNNVSEMAREIGVSRVTLYKYADDSMTSIDAPTVHAFMKFLGVAENDLERFLIIASDPQLYAQEVRNGRTLAADPA